jgi:hypothetical protein|tara:strand:- start:358 stop:558 length:201 start_codon:yes stop_codon:yes gene_type:complete
MTDQNFQKLETEIKLLMKISQQLKESNDHLSKKNTSLLKENSELSNTIEETKLKIIKVIKKIKEQS